MSLLCLTVRRAALVGPAAQFHTYVCLKLQNVKSTTVSVKGNEPNWEQEFIFETNRMDIGLIIEVWNKGVFWDKVLGTQWMPLTRIKYTNEVGEGQWLSLDQELVIENGEVVGTKVPTGHSLLLEAHFELPCDLQDIEEEDLMKKLEVLNQIMDQEISTLREQDRRLNFSLNSGISEDSDYTSDVSYPTGQHPSASVHHPNSSVSQYGGASELARRAYEYDASNKPMYYNNSQGNSYEVDDSRANYSEQNNVGGRTNSTEEPMYYNSRPNYRMSSHSTDRSYSTRSTSGYSNSQDYEDSSDVRYSFETDRSSRHCHWDDDVIDNETDRKNMERFQSTAGRRRSLERQTGFEVLEEKLIDRFNNATEEYKDSTDTYPPESFDSYQSEFPDDTDATATNSKKWNEEEQYSGEYDQANDSYYQDNWSNGTAIPEEPANYDAKEDTQDNQWLGGGSIIPRNNRQKPEVTVQDWNNVTPSITTTVPTTANDWPKVSQETNSWTKTNTPKNDWNRTSPPKNEWNKATPAKNDWNSSTPAKNDWNSTTPVKNDWNTATPAKSDWTTPAKASQPKNDWAKTSPPKNDWGKTSPPKNDWNKTSPPKNDWNKEIPKINEPSNAKANWMEGNTRLHGALETQTNGWKADSTLAPEWREEEPASNHQIDSILSEWQNETVEEEEEEELEEEEEVEEWTPPPERHVIAPEPERLRVEADILDPTPKDPLVRRESVAQRNSTVRKESVNRKESIVRKNSTTNGRNESIVPAVPPDLKPESPPPPRETKLDTLSINNKEADDTVANFRRPSVQSINKFAIDPPLLNGEVNTMPTLTLPSVTLPTVTILDVPELIIVEENASMSRAKRRWINAFNKIVAQLNEFAGLLESVMLFWLLGALPTLLFSYFPAPSPNALFVFIC